MAQNLYLQMADLLFARYLGQVVRQKQIIPARFEDNVLVEDVNDFAAGLYFLILFKGEAAITERFIITVVVQM